MSFRNRVDDRIRVTVQTMNTGRPDEFQRVFFECADGHDMGSVPLDMLDGARLDGACSHHTHRAHPRGTVKCVKCGSVRPLEGPRAHDCVGP